VRPYHSEGGVTIYHGNCLEIMPTLADKSVDHVIADPPYSEHTHKKVRRGLMLDAAGGYPANRRRRDDLGFAHLDGKTMSGAARHFARLAKRWTLVFSDIELSQNWRRSLVAAGLDYVRTGAWVKLGSTPQFTGDRPASGFEAVVIAHTKGRKKWNGGGKVGIWQEPIVISRDHKTPRLHTTQKPIALMWRLISDFTSPDDLILDAFMGSGTTLKAALDTGRRAIGIDLSEENCENAARRLGAGKQPMDMPLFAARPA